MKTMQLRKKKNKEKPTQFTHIYTYIQTYIQILCSMDSQYPFER